MTCVDEVKKDIARRKAVTVGRTGNLTSTLADKEIKNGRLQNIEQAIKNEQFTASDKRKVIDLLLSNENVLLFLYEKLFPANEKAHQHLGMQDKHAHVGVSS